MSYYNNIQSIKLILILFISFSWNLCLGSTLCGRAAKCNAILGTYECISKCATTDHCPEGWTVIPDQRVKSSAHLMDDNILFEVDDNDNDNDNDMNNNDNNMNMKEIIHNLNENENNNDYNNKEQLLHHKHHKNKRQHRIRHHKRKHFHSSLNNNDNDNDNNNNNNNRLLLEEQFNDNNNRGKDDMSCPSGQNRVWCTKEGISDSCLMHWDHFTKNSKKRAADKELAKLENIQMPGRLIGPPNCECKCESSSDDWSLLSYNNDDQPVIIVNVPGFIAIEIFMIIMGMSCCGCFIWCCKQNLCCCNDCCINQLWGREDDNV